MKKYLIIFLFLSLATSALACLNASQNRIFPLGICKEGLVVLELHSRRGEEMDFGAVDDLHAEWRAKGYLNTYTKNHKLIRSEIIDSVIYITENEYVSTVSKVLEKALILTTKIKDFIPARPEFLTFCNYQINCSKINLEIDLTDFRAFLSFPLGERFEISVLQNPESIASNYLEQMNSFDYETEGVGKLYILESLLINSVRQFQIGEHLLTIVHLGMGTSYSEEPIEEYDPDYDFDTIENSVFEEPVLYHGHGFDFFIWQ